MLSGENSKLNGLQNLRRSRFVGFEAEYQMFCKLNTKLDTKNIPIREGGFVLTLWLWSTGERVVNSGLFLLDCNDSKSD